MAKIILIPSSLSDEGHYTIPEYVRESVTGCQAFFVENERTARRFLKSIRKDMVIDDYRWYALGKNEPEMLAAFESEVKRDSTIGILSEAGCPGVADPGQILVARAQALGVTVQPMVGPSSILLALMASGLNGQSFTFHGYLPVEAGARRKKLQALDDLVRKTGSTQLFIETPYRNEQMLRDILSVCHPNTRLCIAANITAPEERIVTKTIGAWRSAVIPGLHKQPVIFLIG